MEQWVDEVYSIDSWSSATIRNLKYPFIADVCTSVRDQIRNKLSRAWWTESQELNRLDRIGWRYVCKYFAFSIHRFVIITFRTRVLIAGSKVRFGEDINIPVHKRAIATSDRRLRHQYFCQSPGLLRQRNVSCISVVLKDLLYLYVATGDSCGPQVNISYSLCWVSHIRQTVPVSMQEIAFSPHSFVFFCLSMYLYLKPLPNINLLYWGVVGSGTSHTVTMFRSHTCTYTHHFDLCGP